MTFNKEKIIKFFSTGFYFGYLPIAPGTWGTILAVPFLFLIRMAPLGIRIVILFGAAVFCVYLADRAEKIFKQKDDRRIVIDEIVGLLVAAAFVPLNLFFIVIAVIVFRFFDVIKPWPARWAQSLPGGWGVVIDDIFAGLYTAGILYLLNFIV